MSTGIIYFIQPAELVGTNRYKIGCSKNPDLERCKTGYRKNSRYLCIMECIDPFKKEKEIKDIFNEKFKLIAGTEFFEGDEKVMLREFMNIVSDNNCFEEVIYSYLDTNTIKDNNSKFGTNDIKILWAGYKVYHEAFTGTSPPTKEYFFGIFFKWLINKKIDININIYICPEGCEE